MPVPSKQSVSNTTAVHIAYHGCRRIPKSTAQELPIFDNLDVPLYQLLDYLMWGAIQADDFAAMSFTVVKRERDDI